MTEIVKQKRYARPQSLSCDSCPHCLQFSTYVDFENYYCLIDDEYKSNDYPEEKNCPFKKQKIERLKIEEKRKYLFENLGNLEYQRYANIEFYGYTEDSETIKELDNLIKQKRKQLKELEDGR